MSDKSGKRYSIVPLNNRIIFRVYYDNKKESTEVFQFLKESRKWTQIIYDNPSASSSRMNDNQVIEVKKELSIYFERQLLAFYGVDNIVKDVVVKICQTFCDVNHNLLSLTI
jgi:hypothetical protein